MSSKKNAFYADADVRWGTWPTEGERSKKHTAEFRSAVLAHLRKDQLILVLKLERFFCGARFIDFKLPFFDHSG